jgi:hypothetical protein
VSDPTQVDLLDRATNDYSALSESESYVTTDSQSASLSWNKAHIWGLRPDLYYCWTVAHLLMWDALSDERTGLSFIIASGTRQRSHSRVRVPWDLETIVRSIQRIKPQFCITFPVSKFPDD